MPENRIGDFPGNVRTCVVKRAFRRWPHARNTRPAAVLPDLVLDGRLYGDNVAEVNLAELLHVTDLDFQSSSPHPSAGRGKL